MARLRHAIDRLSSEPLSETATDIGHVLALFVGRYPCKVFYRVHHDAIEIIHIRHTSRRPAELD